MKRYLDDSIAKDLKRKLVFVTGARQVGKTTLSHSLMARCAPAQYLNFDVAEDRAAILRRSWRPDTSLLVLDELHKMADWKRWLKGVIDGRPRTQQILVTGSARMETFRQTGESLAGRYLAWRLHPISVREWCTHGPAQPDGKPPAPDAALARILRRGGFPEPLLVADDVDADRWRKDYLDGLLREDILEFSRIHELATMRAFVDLLRARVGAPLSLASMARDLQVSSPTLKRYLDILQALFIVFVVQPWHHNVARSLLQAPKVYFFDTGLVAGDEGVRFENAVAGMLLKHVQWREDALGKQVALHYLRTKDGAEVDFALSEGATLTDLVECKLGDATASRAMHRFAAQWPTARAVQLVRFLRNEEVRRDVQVRAAAGWLAALAA
jgi:hypothetical protein